VPVGLALDIAKRTELRPIRCRRADRVNGISTSTILSDQTGYVQHNPLPGLASPA